MINLRNHTAHRMFLQSTDPTDPGVLNMLNLCFVSVLKCV